MNSEKTAITKLFVLLLLLSVSNSMMAYSVITINGIQYNVDNADVDGADPLKNGVLSIPENVTIRGKKYNVTCINPLAFENRTDIKQIELPKSLRTIRDKAFIGCSNLESVTLPANVDSVGRAVFCDCTKLKSFVFSNNIKKIPSAFFEYDFLLENVTFPANLESIERLAFWHCESLKEVELPNQLKEISGYAFSNCTRLSKVILPASLETLEEGIFGGCDNLKTIICLSSNPPKLVYLSYYEKGGEPYFFSSFDDYLVNEKQSEEYNPDIVENCILHVPEEAMNTYQNAEGWKIFYLQSTGIDRVFSADTQNSNIAAIYDLSGCRIPEMRKGVNVVRYSNGSIKKVIR